MGSGLPEQVLVLVPIVGHDIDRRIELARPAGVEVIPLLHRSVSRTARPRETMRWDAAFQIGAQFALDMGRHQLGIRLVVMRNPGGQPCLHGLPSQRALWPAAALDAGRTHRFAVTGGMTRCPVHGPARRSEWP